MSWRIEVTDEDIEAVEEQLGINFDEERRTVLKCMDSCDVQACAGSGKTTTLVAKVAMLAQKIPLDYRGVCVLSHTNAARVELETSLGSYATRLCHYPHFIGTIQRFVDRFLAIPAMIKKYGIRPHAIDNEVFGRVMAELYHEIPYGERYYVERQRQGVKTAKKIRYRFEDLDQICVYDQGQEKDLCGQGTNTYSRILSIKERATTKGYIGYRDAFALANWYLQEYPEIGDMIAHRFPIVFVDEMQDTDAFQSRILNIIFGEASTIQCFGDINQSIYGSNSANSEPGWEPNDILPISSSYRFGRSIANLCSSVSVHPQQLRGRADHPECNHTVFLFNDETMEDVIPAFADLIEEEELRAGPFKAVGAIKKRRDDPTRLSIPSYWPHFEKRQRSSVIQSSLRAYFELARQELNRNPHGNCGVARRFFLEGVTQVLRIQRGERYNHRMLLRELRDSGEEVYRMFLVQLFSWCHRLATDGLPAIDELREAVQRVLGYFEEDNLNRQTLRFITADAADVRDQENAEATNIFLRDGIEIEIDTIHGVKGQNHQATLVLETFLFRVYDLSRLLPYIKGEHRDPDDPCRRRLPVVHVGMTRPSHLLCLAMHRDRVTEEDEQELTAVGWSIEDLTNR